MWWFREVAEDGKVERERQRDRGRILRWIYRGGEGEEGKGEGVGIKLLL